LGMRGERVEAVFGEVPGVGFVRRIVGRGGVEGGRDFRINI
jgi:hypothetical protein